MKTASMAKVVSAAVSFLPCRSLFLAILLHLSYLRPSHAQKMKHVVLGPFQEQQRSGILVGNIAQASNIAEEMESSKFRSLKYEVLDPNNLQTASLFTLNGQTGGVFTSAMIDREAVCEFKEVCLLNFDVSVSFDTNEYLCIVRVSINITDVNDNMPTFPRETITLDITEGNTPGTFYLLPSAVDKDTKVNSVVEYRLQTTTSPFRLHVERNLDDSFKVSLVVTKVLDREERDNYLLRVEAIDGGLPPLMGTLTVHINVTDINDNAPIFSEQTYSISVVENAPVGTVIGRVKADDLDTGMNARITYGFSGSGGGEMQKLFSLHPDSGEIHIKAPLQYVSGNTFTAIVQAKDNGFPAQVSQAQLTITVVDVGNNPPRMEFLPKKTIYENTIQIAENANLRTVIGTVKVEDNDPGLSGVVNCRVSHESFKVQKLVDTVFVVLLQQQLDRELEEKVNVTIKCSDAGSPPMTSSTTFIVIVEDDNDNAPVFSQHVYTTSITEESPKGKSIMSVSAQDFDKGFNGHFLYSLHPKENEMFTLDPKSGELRTNMVFDRETDTEVTVIVKAIDQGQSPLTGTATVVVQILDINDNAPELTSTEFHVEEGIGAETVEREVGTLKARDRDIGINAQVVYHLKDAHPLPPFTVCKNGMIKTKLNMNIDREMQNQYVFEVLMHDLGDPAKTSSATVTVHVIDANDNPPEVRFPNSKNNTVTIMWSQTPQVQFATIEATDRDDGRNAKLLFFIAGGNKNNLFEISKDQGTVYLSRYVEASDVDFHRIKIAVHDSGVPEQETQALLNVRIDLTNATFARQEGPVEMERYTLIAGIVVGATIVICIVIFVVIFHVRSTTRRPRRAGKDSGEWQNDKTGIQEECGKSDIDKVSWKLPHTHVKGQPDLEDVDEAADAGGPSEQVTMGKVVSLPWSNDRMDLGHGDSQLSSVPSLDQYRKQDFYTFCKVRGQALAF